MKWTILGSGGCMVIPKPLCRCRICREARKKGVPYSRTGPSAFLHDISLLIDTPAEIAVQLNRTSVNRIGYITFTHFDPDHVEGLRVVEQITLDFRTWRAYPQKQICLLLPEQLNESLYGIMLKRNPTIDYYVKQGFVRLELFHEKTRIDNVQITALPVDDVDELAIIYIFEKDGRRVIYAPCDIKPFPEHRDEVLRADLLIIQPGIFEDGLKHRFRYPAEHISRTTLYTFEQTLALAERLQAKKVLFVHLEEYWNRSYDDYCELEKNYQNIRFAYDGMQLEV